MSKHGLLLSHAVSRDRITMKRDARSFGGPQLTFRGSRRRVRNLRIREYLGWGFVWFVLWVLFILVVLIPWVGSRPHPH